MVALPPWPGDWATPTPTAALGSLRPLGSLPAHLSLRCSPVLLRRYVAVSMCPVLSPVSPLPPFCSQACALRRSPDGPPSSDPARLVWGPLPCHPPGTHGTPNGGAGHVPPKHPGSPAPQPPRVAGLAHIVLVSSSLRAPCGSGAKQWAQLRPQGNLCSGAAEFRGGQVPPEHRCWGRRNHRGRALGGRDAAHGTFWVGTALQKYNIPHMISFCLSFSLFKNKNSSVHEACDFSFFFFGVFCFFCLDIF